MLQTNSLSTYIFVNNKNVFYPLILLTYFF